MAMSARQSGGGSFFQGKCKGFGGVEGGSTGDLLGETGAFAPYAGPNIHGAGNPTCTIWV